MNDATESQPMIREALKPMREPDFDELKADVQVQVLKLAVMELSKKIDDLLNQQYQLNYRFDYHAHADGRVLVQSNTQNPVSCPGLYREDDVLKRAYYMMRNKARCSERRRMESEVNDGPNHTV